MARGSCCELAREEGVAKVVYTSSVATMGFKADGTIVDETTPVGLEDMVGVYKRSKFMAEQEAIRAAKAGQHVVILNPTTPIGRGGCEADADGTDRGGLSEQEISGVCGYGTESGGCERGGADARGGAGAGDAG